ncbi:hypothetical protein J8F10_28875 [Gemmata sp. G18]|uniref:MFS transporter n=1 Tax=Gemmata palustris TaxID=2822762 RepID=A0ABS5C0V0_9BACT|nr:hypothetical protein [Gemmata palustris]MBP3959277.1 hypothetical protein [Gemmata palustris]
MSARRWFVLLGFVLVSLVLALGWFAWAVFNAPPGQRMSAMGITGILQLLELPLAYGLLRLSDYAHTWAMRLNLVKIVSAAGLTIGAFAGVRDPELIAGGLAICGFFGAYTLFLRRNAEFFD